MITKKTIKTLSTTSEANAIFAALSPETRSTYEKRAQTTIAVKNNRIEIVSKGNHLAYVNASQDSYGKMVQYLKSLTQ